MSDDMRTNVKVDDLLNMLFSPKRGYRHAPNIPRRMEHIFKR